MEDVKAEQYSVILVDADKLVQSPDQPDDRATIGTMAAKALKNSIADIGLQYPPLVLPLANGSFQIVDGHRRIAILKQEFHWPKIPVLPTQGTPEKLFRDVSGTVAKMTSRQWIYVFLSHLERHGSGEQALPSGPNKTGITKIFDLKGQGFLQAMYEKNRSPQMWTVSARVCKYLGEDPEANRELRSKVLDWLLLVGMREVSGWITSEGSSKDELRRALDEMRLPSALGKAA